MDAATAAAMDLVEISPHADPPVCRVMDYGKFLYNESKRRQDAKKKQKAGSGPAYTAGVKMGIDARGMYYIGHVTRAQLSAGKVEKLPVAAAGPAWRIQLVSLSSQKDAEAVWARMQKANTDLLGKLKLQVQTVKLSKGTFYRVQAGPSADRTAAASLCGSLKTRKQDCLVVPPK